VRNIANVQQAASQTHRRARHLVRTGCGRRDLVVGRAERDRRAIIGRAVVRFRGARRLNPIDALRHE